LLAMIQRSSFRLVHSCLPKRGNS